MELTTENPDVLCPSFLMRGNDSRLLEREIPPLWSIVGEGVGPLFARQKGRGVPPSWKNDGGGVGGLPAVRLCDPDAFFTYAHLAFRMELSTEKPDVVCSTFLVRGDDSKLVEKGYTPTLAKSGGGGRTPVCPAEGEGGDPPLKK